MLIRLGTMAVDARGSAGGAVAARNRSGLYIRARVAPTNAYSLRRSNARDYMTQSQLAFRETLDDTKRARWLACAEATSASNKLGQKIVLTPQNAFVAVQTTRLHCGLGIDEDAVLAGIAVDAPTITIAIGNVNGVTYTAASPLLIQDEGIIFLAAGPFNPTVKFFKGPWPYQVHGNGAAYTDDEIVPGANVAVGDRFFVQARFCSHARISKPMFWTLDCAA
jgi:hypothetical protein